MLEYIRKEASKINFHPWRIHFLEDDEDEYALVRELLSLSGKLSTLPG
jgi:hypothetical protein